MCRSQLDRLSFSFTDNRVLASLRNNDLAQRDLFAATSRNHVPLEPASHRGSDPIHFIKLAHELEERFKMGEVSHGHEVR
jgi:hypothetical protein